MHRLHVVIGTCRHHFGCPYYLNPRQQAHIWATSNTFVKMSGWYTALIILVWEPPFERQVTRLYPEVELQASTFFLPVVTFAKTERQKRKHILSKYLRGSGSNGWNKTSRYLKRNGEWRVLARRDSQTHDAPTQFAALLTIWFEEAFSHPGSSFVLWKCENLTVFLEDLMEHWDFSFSSERSGENDRFPQISKAISWLKKGWGRGARIGQSRSHAAPHGTHGPQILC